MEYKWCLRAIQILSVIQVEACLVTAGKQLSVCFRVFKELKASECYPFSAKPVERLNKFSFRNLQPDKPERLRPRNSRSKIEHDLNLTLLVDGCFSFLTANHLV